MTTVNQIRTAIEAALKTITVGNGYSFTVPPTNIYDCWNSEIVARTKDTDYPKLFLLTEGASHQDRASGRVEKELVFSVIVVLKFLKQPLEVAVRQRIENVIDDVERCIHENKTLGNLVETMELTDYTTDSGMSYPEAVAVFTVKTLYFVERFT